MSTMPVTGTVSSAGIGSGLDVSSIVTQLVAAERSTKDTQLANATSAAKVQISALGTFKSALSAFNDASGALLTGGITKVGASSSDSTVFTATAATGTASGSYDVQVVSLAKAEKQVSGSYAASTTSVGSGTVTIASGSNSFSVTLDDSSNSLAALRDAINASDDNQSVNASIVTDSNGSHLVLIGRVTGAANSIAVSSVAAAGGASFVSMTTQQPAVDAHLMIDGVDAYSVSNTVTGAIDGVTLNLLKANPGTTLSLSLAPDNTTATAAIQKFVNSYNALMSITASLTKYDASTKTAGALLGDAAVTGIQGALRGIMGGSAGSGGYTMLAQLGITSATDGTLTVDSTKLSTALSTDINSVQKLFSGDTGIATQINTSLNLYLQTGGQIDAETDSLNSRLKDIGSQQDQLNDRMTTLTNRYTTQFSALDTQIAQLKSTQDYLTQQLTAIASITNNQKN